MSILNRNNVDTTKQPIFLGEKLGLQRFDRYKYPVFFDLFNKQLGNFWRPEELSLTLDRTQYGELQSHEKKIFTKNLLFQTTMDSVVARGIPAFTQYVTNPELELCMNTWGFFENIHSYSYTYIIKNVYSNPSVIFDQALTDPEILKRCDSITKAYDDLNNAKVNLKEKIYLSLVSVNILEAIRFYVSFVCAFAFGENKKMIGNADIIRLIKRDEACVDEITEVLTPHGWKRISELTHTDKVAQYHSDKSITFVHPTAIIVKPHNGNMISFSSKQGHVDMLLTPDHRFVFEVNGQIKEQLAEDFKLGSTKRLPVAGKIGNVSDRKLSTYERFLIALQADGSISDQTIWNGSISGYHQVAFKFKRDRKIERITSLLNELNFDHTVSIDKRGMSVFYVKVPVEYKLSKLFTDWCPTLDSVSLEWCQDFIEEVSNWDGHKRDDESYYYSSVVADNTNFVQTIAVMSGYKTHRYVQVDNRKDSYSDVHRLSILKYTDYHTMQHLSKETVQHNGNVYCVTVPTGMFLAKRNNVVFVTGNCHLASSQAIIKILRDNEEEGFQNVIKKMEPEAIQMFVEGAEEEKAWASYLFSEGSILGLNEEIMHRYIEWLTDSRMKELGLPKQFNTKNPISGWLVPWMSSSSVQVAPQETEITTYKIGATKNDTEEADFSGFSL